MSDEKSGKDPHLVWSSGVKRDTGEHRIVPESRYSTKPPPPPETLGIHEVMARSMSHEMNNVLASLMGLASVLEEEVDTSTPHYNDVQQILAGCRKGLVVTRSYLAFFDVKMRNKTRIALNQLVGTVRSLVLRSTSGEIEIETRLADDLADIEGDQMLIKRNLIQLGLNAVEAIRGSGTVTLTTKNVTLSPSEALAADLRPGEYVRLQVFDTGTGMDKQTLQNAFTPLFSTKRQDVATGLGLPTVARTIGEHGGAVSIYSRPGFGTIVTIYLPALEHAKNTAERAMVTPEETPAPGSYVALLVDDEPLPRSASKRLLNKLGFQVHDVGSGAEALEIYMERGSEFNLVLLDLIMPDMDGFEVIKQLKRLDPEVCIVVCTGYPMEIPIEELGIAGFVSKPYTMLQLREEIERATEAKCCASVR